MANENDYQDDLIDKYTQDLLNEIQQLETVITNRETEIDRLKAENRFLREQLANEKGIYLKS